MSIEANKSTVRRFYQTCMNKADLAAVDEVIALEFIDLIYDLQGANAVKQFIQESHTRFPELNFTIEEMTAEADTVAVRWTGQGRHQNGRSATWTGMGFYHLKRGKIIRHWGNVDQVSLLKQLGMAPFTD